LFGGDLDAPSPIGSRRRGVRANGNGLKLGSLTYRVGRRLLFDAKQERFTDNELANRMRTRPPRVSW